MSTFEERWGARDGSRARDRRPAQDARNRPRAPARLRTPVEPASLPPKRESPRMRERAIPLKSPPTKEQAEAATKIQAIKRGQQTRAQQAASSSPARAPPPVEADPPPAPSSVYKYVPPERRKARVSEGSTSHIAGNHTRTPSQMCEPNGQPSSLKPSDVFGGGGGAVGTATAVVGSFAHRREQRASMLKRSGTADAQDWRRAQATLGGALALEDVGDEFPNSRNLFRLSRMGMASELGKLLLQLGEGHALMLERDYNGRTMVVTAAREGHLEAAALLLEYGCSANTPNNDGWTPLHFACRGLPVKLKEVLHLEYHPPHWAQLVGVLLEWGAETSATTSKGFTALHYACASGHMEAVRLLLAHGVDVMVATKKKATAFHFACYLGHFECVQLLVAHDTRLLHTTDVHGHTGLHFASCRGLHVQKTSRQVHSLFAGLPPLHEDLNLLEQTKMAESHTRHVVDEQYARIVRVLIDAGADRYARTTSHGANPLHVALWLGLAPEARELLHEIGDSEARSPSVQRRLYRRASRLEDAGREVLGDGAHRMGPYHLAAAQADPALLRLLLEFRVPTINLPDALGRTAIHIAVLFTHFTNVSLLFDRGCAADAVDLEGRTPLLLAASQPSLQIIELVAKGLGPIRSRWVEQVDNSYRTALHYACGMQSGADSSAMISWLLEEGVPPSFIDSNGRTPLHLACAAYTAQAEEQVKLLLSADAAVDVQDNEGLTALHLCARNGMEKAAVQLIEFGAVIDVHAKNGQTPLHLSAMQGQAKLVQLLVQHGAYVTRDSLGNSPRDYTLKPATHDLLKVEELRQGFELRFDIVLTFHMPRNSARQKLLEAAGHEMGPPHSELVSADHMNEVIKSVMAREKQQEEAVVRLQRSVRGKRMRNLLKLMRSQRLNNCCSRAPLQICMCFTWPLRLLHRIFSTIWRLVVTRWLCGCIDRLKRIKRKTLTRAKTRKLKTYQTRRRLLNGDKEGLSAQNAPILAVLEALRMARVDYVLARLPGDTDDPRVFICLTMALTRLQQYAERVDYNCRLRKFRAPLDERLHSGTHKVPQDHFVFKQRDEFAQFRSKERISLLMHLLESKDQHDKQGINGAGLDLNALIFHGVLSGCFRLHHPLERHAVYRAWASPGVLPPLFPPPLFPRFFSEKPNKLAPGSHQHNGYFGERKTFVIVHACFYSSYLLFLGLAGAFSIACERFVDYHFDYDHAVIAERQMASDWRHALQVCFSTFLMLWCFGLRKAWARQESVLAYRWIANHKDASEKPLPQFVGRLKINPVTGENELWSSPSERKLKMAAGGLLSALVLVLVVAVQLIPEVAQDEIMRISGLSPTLYQAASSLYTGLMVESMGGWYKGLALRLTEWENHRTPLAFRMSLNMKVFCFMVCNCYFSVVYIAFVDEDAHRRSPEEHLEILAAQVQGLVVMRAVSHIVSAVLLPYLTIERKVAQFAAGQARELHAARTSHHAAHHPGGELHGASEDGMSIVFSNAHLAPPEEVDDTMSHFALQYGFIAGFALASPTIGLLALLINVGLVRATVFKLLFIRQREEPQAPRVHTPILCKGLRSPCTAHCPIPAASMPLLSVRFTSRLRASGLPMWNNLFDTLTVFAVFSNAALILRLIALEEGHQVRLQSSGEAGFSLLGVSFGATHEPPPPPPAAPPATLETLQHIISAVLPETLPAISPEMMMLSTVLLLLLFRAGVVYLLPDEPAWLSLLLAREEHFSHRPFSTAAERRLTAAVMQEQHESRRSSGVRASKALNKLICCLPLAFWRCLGCKNPHETSDATSADEHLDGIVLDLSAISALGRRHSSGIIKKESWLWGLSKRILMFSGAIAALLGAEAAPELL